MPAIAVTRQQGIGVFNGAADPSDPKARIPTFFFDTQGRGVPRFEDMLTIRALERTHTVEIPLNTIKEQIATTPWTIRPTEENPSADVEDAIDDAIRFLDGRYNANRDSFDHLIKQWVHDGLSIDSGILELVPTEDGGPIQEIYARDGATFVKNVNEHGQLPPPAGDTPAYWQFPLTRHRGLHHRSGDDQPLREFSEAYHGLQGYAHLGREPVPFARNQLVWTETNPVTRSVYGMGRVQIAKKIVEILLHQDITNKKHFTANEIPEGVLNIIGANKNEIQRVRQYWNDEVKGQEHKLPIMGGEVKFEMFRPALSDLQFLESQEWYNKIVWMLFGLNQNEVGDLADVNRSTAEEQSTTVWRRTTKPRLETLAAETNRKILPFLEPFMRVGGGFEFAWQFDNPKVRALERKRHQEDLNHGVTTVNEVRRARGEDEVPWGDMPQELRRSVSRKHPEWALVQWDIVDPDEAPERPVGGLLGSGPDTDRGPPGSGDGGRGGMSLDSPLLAPYERSHVEQAKDALRNQRDGDFPPLKGHVDGLTRQLGAVIEAAGEDLIRIVERVLEGPEAARRGAKAPSAEPPADEIVAQFSIADELAEEITAANRDAMEQGAEHHADDLARELEERFDEDAEVVLEFDISDTMAMRQMESSAAARMTTVEASVKEQIRNVITDTYDGEDGNVGTLTTALRDTFEEQLSERHARLVARTETMSASRKGSQALAESTELIGGKEWRATRDGRTRPWHSEMHGTIVQKEQAFQVPGGFENQPSDYPRETRVVGDDQPFNCRCSQQPVLAEDMPEDLRSLALTPGVTVGGVGPDLDSAPGTRSREMMRERAVATETFDEWVTRELDAVDGAKSALQKRLGVSMSTVYDWVDRATEDA